MDSLHRLEEMFAKFPGIGPRQARRFVYYILSKSPAYAKELTHLIEEVRKETHECSQCHRFFTARDKKVSHGLCSICSDASRDNSLLMVVARDTDFESIEKSGAYRGFYFILGGTVPILDKEPEKRIRLAQLLETVAAKKADIREIILSMNTTPDGENTAELVRDKLKVLCPAKVSVLGRGLSTGAELEYVDADTIKNALQNRH
jgi:recombination protein RecR